MNYTGYSEHGIAREMATKQGQLTRDEILYLLKYLKVAVVPHQWEGDRAIDPLLDLSLRRAVVAKVIAETDGDTN